MSTLLDDDFQSYTLGATPPYGVLTNIAIIQPEIVDTATVEGIFGDVKTVKMPSLPALIYPVASPDNSLPAYTELTLFQGLRIDKVGTDQQGTLLDVQSALNPFAGARCASVNIYSDGSLGLVMDGVRTRSSDFALLRNGWYTIQHNLIFFDSLGFLACSYDLGVNGISVFSGLIVSTRTIASMPATWWNNLRIGGCGGGSFLGRLTLYDTVQPMGSVPHAGTPDARITSEVIELVLSPDKWRVYEA